MLADDADKALRAVREAKIIAFDTETSGVDWRKNKPVGYVITADRQNNWYIPIRHGGGGNLMDPATTPLKTTDDGTSPQHRFEAELADAFLERTRMGFPTITFNGKFDCHMSANYGIYLGRHVKDAQHRVAILNEFTRSYSLDAACKEYGAEAKKGDELYAYLASKFGGVPDKKQMANFWRLSGIDPKGIEYACGDGVSTLDLWEKTQPLIDQEELGVIDDLEHQLTWTVFKMERRGILVDQRRMAEVSELVEERLKAAEARLPSGYNSQSNKQTMELMKSSGYTDWPLTPMGNPSFPEKWLKTNEIGRAIVDKRKMEVLKSRYISPIVEKHLFRGRVHTTLHQLRGDEFGTISGRFACTDPNLQAVHKRDKELGRLFRSIYSADPGYWYYEADYSQCEPRLFAHYSEDENLVAGYNSQPFKDAHQVVAELLGVERDPTAKRMNMGIFTGMYPKTFAEHMNWPLETATDKWRAWHNAFPKVQGFQDAAKTGMLRRGFVWTLLGRKCHLDHPRFAYRAVSRIIQGGNADIIKYKMLELDKYCESVGEDIVHLMMTIHDSLNWQESKKTDNKHTLEMIRMMEDVQDDPFNLSVPFIVDWKRGKNWAIATYGEPK